VDAELGKRKEGTVYVINSRLKNCNVNVKIIFFPHKNTQKQLSDGDTNLIKKSSILDIILNVFFGIFIAYILGNIQLENQFYLGLRNEKICCKLNIFCQNRIKLILKLKKYST
jgi:hypothetical protein